MPALSAFFLGTAVRTVVPMVVPMVVAADEDLVVSAPGPSPGSTSASLTVLPLGPDLPPGEDLASVIDTASGTTVRRLGGLGDYAAVSLRGSTFRQVELYLDGLPLNPDGAAAVNLSELPVSAFERVDLYRGMAPIAFGSGAIGGVLDLVTPIGDVPTSATVRLGSFGTAATSVVLGRGFRKGGAAPVDTLLAIDQLHTEGNFRYFDDQGTEYNRFDDRTPTRANNAIDRLSALGRVRYGADTALRITLLDSFVGSHQELPGPISAGATEASLGVTRNLLSAAGDWTPARSEPGAEEPGAQGASHAVFRLRPQVWWLWREEIFEDRKGEIGTGSQHSRDRSSTLGGQASAVWAPAPWLTGTLTGRVRRETYTPYSLLTEEGDGVRARTGGLAAIGADLRLWSDRITVSPAVLAEVLDDRDIGTAPWEHTPVASSTLSAWPTPRIGALVKPLPWLALKGTAGLYLRPPDLMELFGDHGSIIGNEDLLPEQGAAWEVGLRAEAPWDGFLTGSVDLAYARRRVHDLIVYVQNSQYTSMAVNIGEAYLRSTEGALVLNAGEVATSRTNLTWTLGRNLLTDPAYADKSLPNLPSVEVCQQTSLRIPFPQGTGRLAIGHTWSYTGLTFTDTANIGFIAPRNLHGIALELSPKRHFPTIRASIDNLFDVRGSAVDRNPLDPTDDTLIVLPLADFGGYPLPGRTAMVAVSWTDSPRR